MCQANDKNSNVGYDAALDVLSRATVHQAVLRPRVACCLPVEKLAGINVGIDSNLPSGDVLVVVNISVILDVGCCLITRWIATYYTIVVLVDPYIVDSHCGWQ